MQKDDFVLRGEYRAYATIKKRRSDQNINGETLVNTKSGAYG